MFACRFRCFQLMTLWAPFVGYLLLQSLFARADEARLLLEQLTLDEKISLVHGTGGNYTGTVAGVPRLGIPSMTMQDGPQGFRSRDPGTSTAWPCALSMAASWDVMLTARWGTAMAQEFLKKGAMVMLGPGVNVARIPTNGRNFEYLSGEDPVLGATLVEAEIRAIQAAGVIANVKHFVHNNQEKDRLYVDAIVDERTHWELYMPPYEAAVKAGLLSIMCSYNKINGYYACENSDTLSIDLKERLGFKGFVVSDWTATHSTTQAANAGLDMEMPGAKYFAENLKQAVLANNVTMQTLDDKVHRVLYALSASGAMHRPNTGDFKANVTSEASNQLSRELAAAGVVLLKNEHGVLPLSCDLKQIVVIGDIIASGKGSGHVEPPYVLSGYEGISRKCSSTNVTYSPMNDPDFAIVDEADVVLFTSMNSGEGGDRPSLSFPIQDLEVIEKLIAVEPEKVVVVGTTPGAALVPFADKVAAVLLAFMPGQEGGNAIADVLFGDVNPSAKLPMSLPNIDNETMLTPEQYPGVDLVSNYTERLLTGYRWYDANTIKPKFPFGHGLSYTQFTYSDLEIKGRSVEFTITNSGSRDGFEICQLYISFPKTAGEPPKLLKHFDKPFVSAGTSVKVSFLISDRDLSIWDVKSHDWQLVRGTFLISVGPSSAQLPLQGSLDSGDLVDLQTNRIIN